MDKLRHRTARMAAALTTVPFIALLFAGNGFSFTDISDSAAQDDLVKSLQKRIDSLEVRFEKQEIARNEAKKTALDWSRGVFVGGTLAIMQPSDFFTGYMFNIERKNGSSFMLCPMLRLGYADSYNSSTYGFGKLKVTLGLQKSARIADKVGYTFGASLLSVPNKNRLLSTNALGGGINGSINFWFTEKSTIGLGTAINSYFWKPDSISWSQSIRKSDYSPSAAVNFHIIYTQYFLKHGRKLR